MAVSFIGTGNHPEKTTDLPQVDDKFYHIMLYIVLSTPRLSGIRTQNISYSTFEYEIWIHMNTPIQC